MRIYRQTFKNTLGTKKPLVCPSAIKVARLVVVSSVVSSVVMDPTSLILFKSFLLSLTWELLISVSPKLVSIFTRHLRYYQTLQIYIIIAFTWVAYILTNKYLPLYLSFFFCCKFVLLSIWGFASFCKMNILIPFNSAVPTQFITNPKVSWRSLLGQSQIKTWNLGKGGVPLEHIYYAFYSLILK